MRVLDVLYELVLNMVFYFVGHLYFVQLFNYLHADELNFLICYPVKKTLNTTTFFGSHVFNLLLLVNSLQRKLASF